MEPGPARPRLPDHLPTWGALGASSVAVVVAAAVQGGLLDWPMALPAGLLIAGLLWIAARTRAAAAACSSLVLLSLLAFQAWYGLSSLIRDGAANDHPLGWALYVVIPPALGWLGYGAGPRWLLRERARRAGMKNPSPNA